MLLIHIKKVTFTKRIAVTSSPDSRYRIESLARGLGVLRLFDENVVELRLREICDLTGIPMPTAFRMVATLEQDGFLERTPDGRLRPGVSVLTLGSATLGGSTLVDAAQVPLEELAAEVGETVNLGVLSGDEVLYLARLRNADLVTANIQVGSALPAVNGSMGKVLLAALAPEELARRLTPDSFSRAAGPKAHRGFADLEPELARVRENGYAVQDEEVAAGLRSVAVGLRDPAGTVVAAINIAVSTARVERARLEGPLVARLRVAAAEISNRLAAG